MFFFCNSLTSICIPSQVTFIHNDAFNYCYALASVSLPASLCRIETSAFNSTAITDVFFEGTDEDARYIQVGANNAPLTGAAWHYTLTLPAGGTMGSEQNTWLLHEDGLLTISGAMGNFGVAGAPWQKYREYITHVEIEPGVAAIPKGAFSAFDALVSVTIPDSVTAIGDNAFKGCASLTSVSLPDNLSSLGSAVFSGCASLESASIPENITELGVSLFSGCSSLSTLSLPAGLETVDRNAFKNCASLDEVTFAGSQEEAAMIAIEAGNDYLVRAHWHYLMDNEGRLERAVYWRLDEDGTLTVYGSGSMPDYSYAYAAPWYGRKNDILRIVIEDGVQNIGSHVFAECSAAQSVAIASSVTSIGQNAFSGCTSLSEVVLPDSVKKLGYGAFSGCSSLASITLPQSLTVVPASLLYGTAVTSVTLPGSVTSISSSAFSSCRSLTSVTLPAALHTINSSAFASCPALTDIYFGGTALDMADLLIYTGNNALTNALWHCADGDSPYVYATSGVLTATMRWSLDENGLLSITGFGPMPSFNSDYGAPWYHMRASITAIAVGSGVKSIGENAFSGCAAATVSLPDTLTAIGQNAFSGCTALTAVSIPDSVCHIGSYAFYNCRAMAQLTLPDTLSIIEDSAFSGCSALTCVQLPSALTRISSGVFRNTGLTSLVIPENVAIIDSSAFSSCSELVSVSFPAALAALHSSAFSACNAIESISFAGTAMDMTAVVISSGNDRIVNTVWHCSDGDMTYTAPTRGRLSDTVSWSIDDGVLIISGSGSMPGYLNPWYAHRSAIQAICVESGILHIGAGAFSNCFNVQQVSIPNSVVTIGASAFTNCSSLTTVSIPASVVSIDYNAFYNCTSLSALDLPGHLTVIGESAFAGCSALTSVTLPGSLTQIRQSVFARSGLTSVVIPDGVGEIESSAFSSCRSMTSVTLPASIVAIGSNAFNSTALTDVFYAGLSSDISGISLATGNTPLTTAAWTCSDAVCGYPFPVSGVLSPDFDWRLDFNGTLILSGHGAMPDLNGDEPAPWNRFASRIRRLVVESGVTNIGASAFSSYPGLYEVVLPDTMVSIGDSAFNGCRKLTNITLPDSVQTIGCYAFASTGLRSISLPDSVVTLEWGAFENCDALTSVRLPQRLAVVPSSCFWDCDALTSITIPDGVTSIEPYAFYSCNRLRSVSLPASLRAVCAEVFNNCPELKDISFRGSQSQAQAVIIGVSNAGLTSQPWQCADGSYTFATLSGGMLTETMSWAFENGTLTVSGTGAMPSFSADEPAPWNRQAARITRAVIENGVKSIGSYTFTGCTALEEVIFASTVASIGDGAFNACSALHTVDLPGHLVSLGSNAFSSSGLTEITLPDTVTSMGYGVFESCRQLASVTLSSGLTSLPPSGFWCCYALSEIVIPARVTTVEENCFYGCRALTSVTFPVSLLTVRSDAFGNNSALTDVYYDGTAQEARSILFSGYNSAPLNATWHYRGGEGTLPEPMNGALSTSLFWSLDDGVLTISGRGVMPNFTADSPAPWYRNASSITAIRIDGGVRSVGAYAFLGTTALEEVVIPDSVTVIRASAFEDSGIRQLTMPDSVTSLGSSAFMCCRQLTDITLSAGLTAIPDSVFWACSSLEEITLLEGILSIGTDAFWSSGLKRVTLPVSLTDVGANAFGTCRQMTDVYYSGNAFDIFYLNISQDNAPLTAAIWHCGKNPLDGFTTVLNLPAALLEIEEEAFMGTAAQAIALPQGTRTIGSRAFANALSLRCIIIPDSVETIAADAFQGSAQVIVVCSADSPVRPMIEEMGLTWVAPW